MSVILTASLNKALGESIFLASKAHYSPQQTSSLLVFGTKTRKKKVIRHRVEDLNILLLYDYWKSTAAKYNLGSIEGSDALI